MIHPITPAQANNHSSHELIWRAHLRSGEVMWEQPGVSSGHLPADEVVGIDYVPCRQLGLPTIQTRVDLGRDERFVRYWTNIWSPNARGIQRLYVAGVKSRDRHALIILYPRYNKIAFANTRPFHPLQKPDTFRLLPPSAIILGGPGTPECGWVHEGFGGMATKLPDNRIEFRAIYR